jgi:FAD:protein FMN transferase
VSAAVAAAARGVVRVEHVMGMPIVVDVRDVRDVDDEAALEPLFDWFRVVDRRFSTYRDDSEIS